MAHLQPNYHHTSNAFSSELSSWRYRGTTHLDTDSGYYRRNRRKNDKVSLKKTRTLERVRSQCSTTSSSSIQSAEEVELVDKKIEMDVKNGDRKGQFGHLVSENGWQVRRMVEKEDEMREVAHIQAEAFHEPSILFNELFFQFFQAEVLAGLLYRLRNSPPDRYACLVAEPTIDTTEQVEHLVGVVDVTVLNDNDVLQYLSKADEYLYISGIAVLQSFRRKKVATVLLKACEMLAIHWGFEYLALRAYEDDPGARNLYTNAGYSIVSGDPPWTTTWIGRRRRVLMIKQSNILT